MTNLEKFVEVFGFEPDRNALIDDSLPILIGCCFYRCDVCPFVECRSKAKYNEDTEMYDDCNEIWWNSEYKGE